MPERIFVSYCRKDTEIADAFYEAASRHNLKVWYDKLIPAGSDWRQSIVDALQHCDVLLIFFSAESNNSIQLIKELAIADRQGKPVIPVLIEDTEPKGAYLYEMASRNWINLFPNPARRMHALAEMVAKQLSQLQVSIPAGLPSVDLPSIASSQGRESASKSEAYVPHPQAIRSMASRQDYVASLRASSNTRKPWFPARWYDFVVLIPILIAFFFIEMRHSGGAVGTMIALFSYMIIIAFRNADLNRGVTSAYSFASYVIICILIIPFGLLPDWLHSNGKIDFAGISTGLFLISVFLAMLANVLQVILRKAFQLAVFRSQIEKSA